MTFHDDASMIKAFQVDVAISTEYKGISNQTL